jgi:hypothetical protein
MMKNKQATKTVTIEIIKDIALNRRERAHDEYGRWAPRSYRVGTRKRVPTRWFDRFGNIWRPSGGIDIPIYADVFRIVQGRPLAEGERFDKDPYVPQTQEDAWAAGKWVRKNKFGAYAESRTAVEFRRV